MRGEVLKTSIAPFISFIQFFYAKIMSLELRELNGMGY